MFNPTKTVIRGFTPELTSMCEETYGILEPSYPGVISFVAGLALAKRDQCCRRSGFADLGEVRRLRRTHQTELALHVRVSLS